MMKKSAFHLFNPFIYNDSLLMKLPKLMIFKLPTLIRVIAKYNSDPSALIRFMNYQKQMRLRSSSLIEICRFLVLFPDYRSLMLDEIDKYHSKSNYNQFMLYMFKYILNEIISEKLPSNYVNQLEFFYSNFIVHSYLYWNDRKNKMFFRSVLECFACSYFEYEEKMFIQGLLFMYPFDPNVHKYYGEMQLNFYGKYNSYKKERIQSIQLKKRNRSSFDPLLHIMALKNPKILQFCNQELKSSIFNSNSSSDKRFYGSSAHFQNQIKKDKIKQKKTETIASKIIRSKRRIPYFSILNYILPTVFILVFISFAHSSYLNKYNKGQILFNSIDSIQQSFLSIASTIFIPISFFNYSLGNITNENDCYSYFHSISSSIISSYLDSPVFENISDVILFYTFHEMNELVMQSNSVCEILTNMFQFFYKKTYDNIDSIFNEYGILIRNIENTFTKEQNIFNFKQFVLYGSLIMIIFLVIYFITVCITMNTIMHKEHNIIDFLSSKKRLAYIFTEPESRDNLWYLANGIESESSFPLDFDSELETVSLSTSFKNTNNASNELGKSKNTKIVKSLTDFNLEFPKNFNVKSSDEINTDASLSIQINKSHKTSISNSSFSGNPSNNISKIAQEEKSNKTNEDLHTSDSINVKSEQEETDNQNVIQSLVEEEIFDEIELATFLNQKKKETAKYCSFSVIMKVIFPWILLYIIILIAYFPLSLRANKINNNGEQFILLANDFNSSLLLLNESLRIFYTSESNESLLKSINNKLYLNQTRISDLYFQIQCFNYISLHCLSVNYIVQQLIQFNFSRYFLEETAIPILFNFSQAAIRILDNEIHFEFRLAILSSYSFIILIVVFEIGFIIFGYINTKSLQEGFNSLFHFPSQSIYSPNNDKNTNNDAGENKEEENPNNSIENDVNNNNKPILNTSNAYKRYPTNILIISSVIETDEIYFISDSCSQIINKKPSEMICKKFSKFFPLTKEMDGFDIREFNGKSFISRSLKVGKLYKTVLIEFLKTDSKYKSSNMQQKLINFMPFYFAKPFTDNFINFFHLNKSILIFIRIDSKVNQIDNFFTVVNRIDQSFSDIDFIRSNGSVLTFICTKIDALEVILFLRDLISSIEESSKKQVNNFGLKSIYINEIDELNISIREGDIEPETVIEDNHFYALEALIFYIDDHCIGCSNEITMILDEMIKLKDVISKHDINFIPFKMLMSKVENMIT